MKETRRGLLSAIVQGVDWNNGKWVSVAGSDFTNCYMAWFDRYK